MQTIKMIFEPTGEFSIETEGFHGAGCQEVIKALAGDATVLEEHKTPEFYEAQEQTEHAR